MTTATHTPTQRLRADLAMEAAERNRLAENLKAAAHANSTLHDQNARLVAALRDCLTALDRPGGPQFGISGKDKHVRQNARALLAEIDHA